MVSMIKRLLCCLGWWLALTSAGAQSRQTTEEPYEWQEGRRGEARYQYLYKSIKLFTTSN